MQRATDRFFVWVAATVWRDGGQRGARINAWQAMVVDAGRARARAEAAQAVERVQPSAPRAASR